MITARLLAVVVACASPGMARAQVAARVLPRNTIISAADVATGRADGARAGANGASRIGWVTQRTIRAGEPLVPPAVAPAPLVRRGASVLFVFDDGSIRVSRRAEALRDAALGEPCPIRITADEPGAPHRVITGRVVGPGMVGVGRPRPSVSQEYHE